MSSSTNKINPRPCVYGCGIQLYWNASVNEYWEVITKKRHICPNIVSNKNKTSITPPSMHQSLIITIARKKHHFGNGPIYGKHHLICVEVPSYCT